MQGKIVTLKRIPVLTRVDKKDFKLQENKRKYITRDTCFPGGGTHITRDMCFPGGGTHITRDMCFPGRET